MAFLGQVSSYKDTDPAEIAPDPMASLTITTSLGTFLQIQLGGGGGGRVVSEAVGSELTTPTRWGVFWPPRLAGVRRRERAALCL